MNTQTYAIFTFIIFHYNLIWTDCSIRHKRGTPSELTPNHVGPKENPENSGKPEAEIRKITENGERLYRYLYAFNSAVSDTPDTRKGGLGSTFEMKFMEGGHTDEEVTLRSMLKAHFVTNHVIVNGEMTAIEMITKKSVGKKLGFWKFGFGEKYIKPDHAKSIVRSALHSYWANIVGQFLLCECNQYMPKLEETNHIETGHSDALKKAKLASKDRIEEKAAPVMYSESAFGFLNQGDLQTRLNKERKKLESDMPAIKLVLSDAYTFFQELTSPQSHSQKSKNVHAHEHHSSKDNTSIAQGNILSYASSLDTNDVLEKLYEDFESALDMQCAIDIGGADTVRMRMNNSLRKSLLPQFPVNTV